MDLKRWHLLGPSGLIMNQHFGPTFHGYPRKILAMHNLQEPLQEKQKVVQWFFLCPITDRFLGQKLSNWAIELELAPTSINLFCYYQLVLILKYKGDMETRKWRQSGNVLINFYICLIFSNHLFLAYNSII